jgi:chromosome segregation ATPase
MIKKNTYSRAYEACETFFSDTGQVPTIESIKPIIGINSPSIISSAIKDWKAALSQAIKKDQGLNAALPSPLLDTATKFWQQALIEARATLDNAYNELQSKQAEINTKEAALIEEKNRIQQLLGFSEHKYQEEINYLKKELNRLTSDSATLAEQTQIYRGITVETEKKNAVLAEEIRQEKEKFQRLEAQYDKEHEWALKRIEEEKNSYRQQTQNEMSRLQSEASRSKQDTELLQAKLDMLTKQADESRSKLIDLERNLSDEKLKLAGLTLNEAKLQKELNAKDDRIRTLISKAGAKKK